MRAIDPEGMDRARARQSEARLKRLHRQRKWRWRQRCARWMPYVVAFAALPVAALVLGLASWGLILALAEVRL